MSLRRSMTALALTVLTAAAPAQTPAPRFTPAEIAADEQLVEQVGRRMLDTMKTQGWVPKGVKWPALIRLVKDAPDLNAYAYYERTATGELQPRVDVLIRWTREIAQGDPDVLAVVIGHELGHLHHRHPLSIIDPAEFARLALTRAQETEADLFGKQLLLASGYSLRKGLEGSKRLLTHAGQLSRQDTLRSTHPGWNDRFLRMDDDPRYWRSMSAFASGVTFLGTEQFVAAIECFDRVLKEFPGSYEAWVNRGYAHLMLYCDGLSADDLKALGVGHVVTGGFYARPRSLAAAPRERNPKDWQEATASFHRALALKSDLALARAYLGLAHLFHPEGSRVGDAVRELEEAERQLADDRTLDPLARASLLVNLGVTHLADGNRKAGTARFDQALAAVRSLTDGSAAGVQNAVLFNSAMVRGSAGEQREAAQLFERFLRQSDAMSAWWSLAYDRYVELCRQVGLPVKERRALRGATEALLRPILTLDLPDGQRLTLGEPTADALRLLGEPEGRTKLAGGIERLHYRQRGFDLLATDQLLAIVLDDANAPALPVRMRGLGGQTFEVRVGMSSKEVEQKLGVTLVERKLFAKGMTYEYYRKLGLAIRYEGAAGARKVREVIVVQIADPRK